MCGIAGHISKRINPAILPAMLATIAHRGPDGEGAWKTEHQGWHVSLGHRRLAIIDLETGAQPLAKQNTAITFNGEIYNYRELRETLGGIPFTTASDTEVLFELLRHRELPTALRSLNGMFAFGFWEGGQLTLVRDRAGIKPLYYTELGDGGIVFASELSALLAHPGVARTLHPAGLAEYFFLDYTQAPTSILRGVKKLPPGTYLTWENGKISAPVPYWRLPPSHPNSKSERSLAEELLARLQTAVERELVADVPVGVLLSGGLDSSFIAALAQKIRKHPIRTFSIGFAEADYDESRYARTVATHIGSQHTEKIFSEANLLECVEQVLHSLDEPLADPSLLPSSLLARTAQAEVKVALGGDGGDELWAGYPTYRAARYARLYAQAPRLLTGKLLPQAASLLPTRNTYQSFEWKLKRFTQRWDEDPLHRHFRWMSSVDIPDLAKLSPAFTLEEFWNHLEAPGDRDMLNRELALDFQTYLPGSVLPKVDRASMAVGLEVRPPFLEPDFVDWSFSLPSTYKLRRGTSKYLLKLAAKDLLPAEIIHRRKKGFGIPLARWLNGPLAPKIQAVIAESPLWENVRQETFRGWQAEHRAGKADRSRPLWAMLVLDRWLRRFPCGR